MTESEVFTAREVRRQLERRSLDVTLANVSVNKGVVTVSGQIKGLRSDPYVDVKAEMELFHKQAIRMVRGIKDVVFECRVILEQKKEKDHGHIDALPGMHPNQKTSIR